MIDWAPFDKYPEDTIRCNCGGEFRSHAKFVFDPKPGIVSRKLCPACGRADDIRSASSDPEMQTL